mgnify:CR=1 FL=1
MQQRDLLLIDTSFGLTEILTQNTDRPNSLILRSYKSLKKTQREKSISEFDNITGHKFCICPEHKFP